MDESTDAVGRAPLYSGRGFPLDALSPDEFEEFVFGSLRCVQGVLGLRITGIPSGAGDGGFDVQGEVVGSGRLVCVQCKRQKTPIGTPQVAQELAKVAATMALEGSDVGEHRFICTGGVRTKLLKHLRENSRQQLAVEAGNQLVTTPDGVLATLRTRLEEDGADPRQIVETYVLGLDLLIVWGLREFDAALSPCWSDVLKVAEKYFQIATVVREHPRASFDRVAYIEEHRDFRVTVKPRLGDSSLPDGVSAFSAANPCAELPSSQKSIKMLHELGELQAGELAMLLGDGGVGKSTALKWLRAEVLRITPDSTLPVLISLANYVPGGLDRAIHQELMVDHGTWQSLPDNVLLLCDGLNECPSTNVAAFLDELQPLLKRSRIACILSTRKSTRHKNIVLPKAPVACLRVEGITPIGIRRIAEAELHDGTSGAFIDSYRSLADMSGTPLLWTPFAVLVALRLWKRSATLPETLGEMLEALLKARCERNAESPEQSPGPEIILLLAGALAFQCLLVDRRLGCPSLAAGRCVREAKTHCSNALGITDMSESDAVELLARHELLQVSDSHLSFGHQLLAGALAAPFLAREWREHTNCLEEPIVDDAWVFAARLVPNEHKKAYLEATLSNDLMLGARVACELPKEFHEGAERLLLSSIAQESPEIVQSRGYFALARLQSSGAIAKLREFTSDEKNPAYYIAQCALAAAGDRDYLQRLLPKVEQMRLMPGKVSGGEIGIWEHAPYSTRLDIVRQRLCKCNPGDPVNESLSLIAYEKDLDDAELVESHLRASTSLNAWQWGLYALREIAPMLANEYLEETLSRSSTIEEQANLMHSAALVGFKIDIRRAFKCAISEIEDKTDSRAKITLDGLISDIIIKSVLPPDLVAVVERELPGSSGDLRTRFWQIASMCNSTSIAEYALSCLEDWGPDLGFACNFFIEQSELAQAHRELLISLCENKLGNEQSWYTWGNWRVLALVGVLGFSKKTAKQLSDMIKRLTRVQLAVDSDNVTSLTPGDAEVLKSTKLEHARIHLGGKASQLISVAAQARKFLSKEDLLSLLHFDTKSHGVVERLREALYDISDVDIDGLLSQITEYWTRLSGLHVACARGSTEVRIRLLAQELQRSYTHPAALHIVRQAIEACWCESVCEMVMKSIAEIPVWPEHDTQFFWGFSRAIAKRLGPENQTVIGEEISRARTAFARRILKLWYDNASRDRVGLARLSS
ncbi:MAG: restriction endonuclease [Thermodesulfobacteriota bacterium]